MLFPVAKLCSTLWPHGQQHTRLLCAPLFFPSLLKFLSIVLIFWPFPVNHYCTYGHLEWWILSLTSSVDFPQIHQRNYNLWQLWLYKIYLLINKAESQNCSLNNGLQNGYCVIRHENNTDLSVCLHQSSFYFFLILFYF